MIAIAVNCVKNGLASIVTKKPEQGQLLIGIADNCVKTGIASVSTKIPQPGSNAHGHVLTIVLQLYLKALTVA